MEPIPPPPTPPESVDLGVPVPLPRSPAIWQDISVSSSNDLSDLFRPPSLTRPPQMITVPAPPPIVIHEPPRGRSRSRSYSPIYDDFPRTSRRCYSYVSPSRSRSRSRTPSPCRCPRRRPSYRPRSMTPSPERRYSFHAPLPPQPIMFAPPPQPPIFVCPPRSPTPLPSPPPMQPTIIVPGPSFTPQPPVSPVSGLPYEPVDIVTFNYNKDMAYAPAAKTYDEAIDTVLELWPELRSFDRERISLLVGGSDQFVRVPKVAWRIVLGDLPRYEVIHVHVDQQPPPPQYQGDEKGKGDGKWGGEDNKGRRSRGFFSSIKRIFRC